MFTIAHNATQTDFILIKKAEKMKYNIMKKLATISLICLFIGSCSKEENTTTAPINDPGNGGTLLVQGNFSSRGGYSVSGSAKLFDNAGVRSIRLENFSSSNGPDLKVYLAKDINAASFINLGNLKSISGNQNYALTGMPDLAQYKYVLIWCQQFGVGFGTAELQ
jgi:Electron transfer DM13